MDAGNGIKLSDLDPAPTIGDKDEEALYTGNENATSANLDAVEIIRCTDIAISKEPSNISLLLRHRAPPKESLHLSAAFTTTTTGRHKQELERIYKDSAAYTRHALVFDDTDQESDEPWKWCCKQYRNQQQQRDTHTCSSKVSTKCSVKEFLQQQGIFPCQQFIGVTVNWQTLRKDIIAGISVAIVAIPLSMSYAKLAGLPAYYGLYANLPACVYPIFGSSLQLAVGPAALVSLLLSTSISDIVATELPEAEESSDEYVARYAQLAIQTSFMVGIVKIGMGLFKLGFVTQIMSKALISGFTSGAAVMIAMSQVKHLLGVNVPASSRFHDALKNLIEDADNFSWKTFLMGSLAIIFLVSLKFAKERNPQRELFRWLFAAGPVVVSALSIILTYALELDESGIPVVGEIPKGLPNITVDQWTPFSHDLWIMVISIVIVGYVQSFSIAKRIAYKRGYEIDSSQELIGLGVANLVGSIFQSFPVTGAMGQSAVNDEIGAETGIAGVATTAVVLIVLLLLTPVFELMPLTVLAAIVISFVLGMFDYTEALYLYKVHKFDFSIWIVAFFSTMFLGVEIGLGTAVGVSLLIVIYESVYPRTAVLGRLTGTSLYRNIKQYPTSTEQYDGLVIVRIDSPLYFANAQNIRDKVRKYKRNATEELKKRHCDANAEVSTAPAGSVVEYIILDLSPVSHMDTTGLHVLEDMHATQKREGVTICFCNPNMTVITRLVRSGLVDSIGHEFFFPSVIDAVQWCLTQMDGKEDACVPERSV